MPKISKSQIAGIVGASDKSNLEERIKVLDGFATPEIAVIELLQREKFNQHIWEPAAGQMDITKVLTRRNYLVYTSDIYQWDNRINHIQDFLTCANLPQGQRCDIITNPPFSLGQEFVEKSLELLQFGSKLALLLRLQFLEGKTRKLELYDKTPPVRVLVFSYRLPRMHRFGYIGPKSTSMVCFAWFIFQKGNYKKDTAVKWV